MTNFGVTFVNQLPIYFKRTKVLIACTYMYTNDCSDAFNDIVVCKFSAMEDQ